MSKVSAVDSDVVSDIEEGEKLSDSGEKSSDIEEEEKSIPNVREELRRRLAEPGGSPPVWKTLYAWVGREACELSYEPGSIITEVRPTETREQCPQLCYQDWLIGTLEGVKTRHSHLCCCRRYRSLVPRDYSRQRTESQLSPGWA